MTDPPDDFTQWSEEAASDPPSLAKVILNLDTFGAILNGPGPKDPLPESEIRRYQQHLAKDGWAILPGTLDGTATPGICAGCHGPCCIVDPEGVIRHGRC